MLARVMFGHCLSWLPPLCLLLFPRGHPRLAPPENRVLATSVVGFQTLPRPGGPQAAVGQTPSSQPQRRSCAVVSKPLAPWFSQPQTLTGPCWPGSLETWLWGSAKEGSSSWVLGQGQLESGHHKATGRAWLTGVNGPAAWGPAWHPSVPGAPFLRRLGSHCCRQAEPAGVVPRAQLRTPRWPQVAMQEALISSCSPGHCVSLAG